MVKELIDVGLGIANILSIKENHTEAKTKKEREEQRERRRNISDMRNIAFLARRFFR